MILSAQLSELVSLAIFRLFAISATLTIRGFAKTLVAKWAGDKTATHQGLLTLNPMAHTNLITIAVDMVLFTFIHLIIPDSLMSYAVFIIIINIRGNLGWTTYIPINTLNFKNYFKGTLMVALAGPIANLAFAFIIMNAIRLTVILQLPVTFLKTLSQLGLSTVMFSTFIAIMHLLPPQQDGVNLFSSFGHRTRKFLHKLEPYHLIMFILSLTIANYLLTPVVMILFKLMPI